MKIYVMESCPDCTYVEAQIPAEEKEKVTIIDIGTLTTNLKEFLKLRDEHPAFAAVRGSGSIGIPCFILEDGTVTLIPEEVGFRSRPVQEAGRTACRLDGSGC